MKELTVDQLQETGGGLWHDFNSFLSGAGCASVGYAAFIDPEPISKGALALGAISCAYGFWDLWK